MFCLSLNILVNRPTGVRHNADTEDCKPWKSPVKTIGSLSIYFYQIVRLTMKYLKRKLWDRQWSLSSIGISSHICWFSIYINEFLIMKRSNLPSFRAICCMQHFIFLLSYCNLYLVSHKFWSVLTCNILGIGLLLVQYLFKTIICWGVRMKKHIKIL